MNPMEGSACAKSEPLAVAPPTCDPSKKPGQRLAEQLQTIIENPAHPSDLWKPFNYVHCTVALLMLFFFSPRAEN